MTIIIRISTIIIVTIITTLTNAYYIQYRVILARWAVLLSEARQKAQQSSRVRIPSLGKLQPCLQEQMNTAICKKFLLRSWQYQQRCLSFCVPLCSSTSSSRVSTSAICFRTCSLFFDKKKKLVPEQMYIARTNVYTDIQICMHTYVSDLSLFTFHNEFYNMI